MLKRERPVLITWQRVAARLVADWRSAVGDGGICHWRQDNPLPRKARVKIEGRREAVRQVRRGRIGEKSGGRSRPVCKRHPTVVNSVTAARNCAGPQPV